jgi:hypothetical protein
VLCSARPRQLKSALSAVAVLYGDLVLPGIFISNASVAIYVGTNDQDLLFVGDDVKFLRFRWKKLESQGIRITLY